ncbi:Peptidyl-alpha-hydroxyglycine alpha-amidating lyase 2 [Armadillidium vulgare]|nr:Peptidyl-alpha-hydroxyglycine alpha-amidating lyase 2 [Armadillidium vulgare]
MFLFLKTVVLFHFVWSGVFGRIVPYYDLDEDFYSDIRNILEDHLSRQVPNTLTHPREVRGWGLTIPNSHVSGVAVDVDGNPVIFHRGNRFWNYETFNSTQHIQTPDPIPEDVVMILDKESGEVIEKWGKNMFYLPHGITIDKKGNTWLTDAGSHQVFKFPPGSKTASLTLGEKLQPGEDNSHFCKPSAVAVASSGEFFVADGYCNARVLHFSPDGTLKGQYGHYGNEETISSLNVPHGLTLNEELNTLCIADRDNGRIVCIKAGLNDPKSFGKDVVIIPEPNHIRVFDIAFVGNGLVGISGSEEEGIALGFTANIDHRVIVDQWEPIQNLYYMNINLYKCVDFSYSYKALK